MYVCVCVCLKYYQNKTQFEGAFLALELCIIYSKELVPDASGLLATVFSRYKLVASHCVLVLVSIFLVQLFGFSSYF